VIISLLQSPRVGFPSWKEDNIQLIILYVHLHSSPFLFSSSTTNWGFHVSALIEWSYPIYVHLLCGKPLFDYNVYPFHCQCLIRTNVLGT
jgi:hypothetical protein